MPWWRDLFLCQASGGKEMTAHDLGDKSISVGDEISIGMSPFKYHIFLSKVNHFIVLIINFYLTNLV